ncbi:MAG TPA: 6,7-dimethyl-8-ribityllumazine synthase, partial [Novosphingobium sp.]|nr:6,7-dimethyl-8-ribityllumazine synthase [Novosphingobium sp.]
GILTVENEEQALVRADPKQKDKGGEAAKAAMALLALREKFA